VHPTESPIVQKQRSKGINLLGQFFGTMHIRNSVWETNETYPYWFWIHLPRQFISNSETTKLSSLLLCYLSCQGNMKELQGHEEQYDGVLKYQIQVNKCRTFPQHSMDNVAVPNVATEGSIPHGFINS
jgi:hypothetical protein